MTQITKMQYGAHSTGNIDTVEREHRASDMPQVGMRWHHYSPYRTYEAKSDTPIPLCLLSWYNCPSHI